MLWIFDVRVARETMDAVGKPRLDLRKKEMSDFAKQMDGVTETSSNYRTFCWSIQKGTSRLPPGPSSATLATARSLGSTSYTLNARAGGFGFLFTRKARIDWFSSKVIVDGLRR
jgi:hypothetical protein